MTPWRTSPTAKMPWTLVSSEYGSRAQPFGRLPPGITSRPVRMKPASLRSTRPATSSVYGAAPMNTNIALASIDEVAPPSTFR